MAACERCPSPGACGAVCPAVASLRRLQNVEFGKKSLTVNSLKEVPEKFEGIVNFNPVRQISSELPIPINKFASSEVNEFTSKETRTSGETCSKCNELASTCSHSKSRTSALKAA